MADRDEWQAFRDDLRSGRADKLKKVLSSKKDRERILALAYKVEFSSSFKAMKFHQY